MSSRVVVGNPQFRYFSFSAWTSLERYGHVKVLASSFFSFRPSPFARCFANLISHPQRLYRSRMFGWISTDNRRERTIKYASTSGSPRCFIT